jgi:hypothetical protein
METRGDVAQTSERSTCAMSVSCEILDTWRYLFEEELSYLDLIVINDASIRFYMRHCG